MTDQIHARITAAIRDTPARYPDDIATAVKRAIQPELDSLAALRQVARGYCPECGRGDAAPTVEDWAQQRQRADPAEAEARRWLAFIERGIDTHMSFGVIHPDGTREQLPCADWCYACRVGRAEGTVRRVVDLCDRWVKAGPPPIGVPLSRWWDARLVELHNAIVPPDPPKES